ncbi:leptin receptor [Hyperolius riggenbachi]|uniref:leptin receptor n=1 Tax=Hyperolius riggenbachi TaxID=752182 RepID=UPI0035A36ACD
MSLHRIFTILLQWEWFLLVASLETYRMPPSGMFLSYFSSKPPSIPEVGGATQNVRALLVETDSLGAWNYQCSGSDDGGRPGEDWLCLWKGSDQQESAYDEYLEVQRNILLALPPDIQLVDHTWKLLCWRAENSSRLTCEIQYMMQKTFVSAEVRLNLFYADQKEEVDGEQTWNAEGSTQRQRQGNNTDEERRNADCRCLGYKSCDCSMKPYRDNNDSYTVWLEVTSADNALLSPPISIEASAIIKPDPPRNLSITITEDGKLKVVWSGPKSSTHRLQYQVRHYFNTSENKIQTSVITEDTFLILDVAELCSPLVFEVRCRTFPHLGVWSEWSSPAVFKSQDGFYFPQKVLVGSGSDASIYCMLCHDNKKVPAKFITWALDLAKVGPSNQFTTVSEYVGKVTLENLNATRPKGKFQYEAMYCCTNSTGCQPHYAEIYVVDVNINITCETDGKISNMTCRWSAKHIPLLKDSIFTFHYYRDTSYYGYMDIKYDKSTEKDCILLGDGSYECVFLLIKSTYSYKMWVEIQHPLGRLQSTVVCVRPVETVKPFPVSDVRAEMTASEGHLNVAWGKPKFGLFIFKYQLRYRVQGPEDDWKILDIFGHNSIRIEEVDACKSYIVQVRCRISESNASGYWSNWSSPISTALKDIRAPSKGPEFWRLVQENNLQKGDNITLIWQPVKEPLVCFTEYEVSYITPNVTLPPIYIGNATNVTFTLQRSDVTVTVLTLNSLGHSRMNRNLTLSQKVSSVQAVESLEVYRLNNSAVATWKLQLLPPQYHLLELVLEWRNLRDGSHVSWVYVSPSDGRHYIKDQFFSVEKYQFSLAPVFVEGIGSPKISYEFCKKDFVSEMQNNTGLYVILPAITATSFLLVITLAISHQRMKRMFWKDVPNPKYCSWAQGVNFQKSDAPEHLFTKHRDHLAHGFPLILEPEVIFENLNIIRAWENEEADEVSVVGKLIDDHDSACASSHFSSTCTYGDHHETALYGGSSCQTSVKYATILGNPQQSKTGINGRRMSSSSCDGRLLGNNLVNNLDNEAFLIMAGLQTKQPSKMSSNSTTSSEGFSEPSEGSFEGDSPEKNLYYAGLGSGQNDDQVSGYFSENPLITYHIQESVSYGTIDFNRKESAGFINKDYGQQGMAKKSYVPQFKTQCRNTADLVDICT